MNPEKMNPEKMNPGENEPGENEPGENEPIIFHWLVAQHFKGLGHHG